MKANTEKSEMSGESFAGALLRRADMAAELQLLSAIPYPKFGTSGGSFHCFSPARHLVEAQALHHVNSENRHCQISLGVDSCQRKDATALEPPPWP